MTHPAVIECAITGVPDEIRGQVVKATIVLSKDYKARAGEELIKELQNHVKKVTATKTLKEDFFYGDIALCPYISLSLIFPRENFP